MFVSASGGREGIRRAAVPEHGLAASQGVSAISPHPHSSIRLVSLCFFKPSAPAVPGVLVPGTGTAPAGASLSAGRLRFLFGRKPWWLS